MAEEVDDWVAPSEGADDWVSPAQKPAVEGATPLKPGATWGEAATTAVKNVGPSAIGFGKAVAHPFLHPIQTAESIRDLGYGLAQKAGVMEPGKEEEIANAVGRSIADRYGGLENIKKTMAEDPVGLAGDLSMILTGGGAAAVRAPGIIGKVGEVASAAGRYANPLTPVIKGAELGAKSVTGVIGGLGTGTGGESIRIGARAGYEGGEAAKAFRDNMRGNAPMEETVDAARQAVAAMRQERGNAYRSGMVPIAGDKTILSFNDLDTALMQGVKVYKGESISPSTEAVRNKMWDAVERWKNLPASEFHTAEGFDQLKQLLGDIRSETEYGSPARLAANNIYNAAKSTIQKQVPEYAKVMKGYEEASRLIKEMERTLSLNPNATVDTSLRKLQSVLRNNVTTAYGRRKELADFLVNAGAPHLMERLAGQALQPGLPRGMTRFVAQIGAEVAATLGVTAGGLGLPALGGVAATLPFMSPRLMGEAAYFSGRAAAPLKYVPLRVRPTGLGTFEAGRLGQTGSRLPGFQATDEQKRREAQFSEGFARALSGQGKRGGGRVDTKASTSRALRGIK